MPVLPFLRGLVEVDEVDSTNDLARRLLAVEDHPTLPFAIRALRQTKGRGRGANRWWSDAGSLTITFVLDPSAHALTISHESRLALVGALTLIEAVNELRPRGRLGLKWPNDVELGRKKVAGFLTERVEAGDRRCVILGMGVNVTTKMSEAPPEVGALATSLADSVEATGGLSIESLLHAFLLRFENRLRDLAADAPALPDLWNAYDLLRDVPVRVRQGDHVVEGVGAGIDGLGGLIVQSGDEWKSVYGGTVERLTV